jgi:ABC-2 type transport system permease protein
MLFSRNFSRLSILIDNGSLDGLLIKPLDSQFLVSVGQVNYTALVRSVLGIILLAYLVNTIHFSFNFLQIFIYILLILCGIVLTYCIWLMVSTLLIWLPRLSNLIDLLHFLSGTGRYPAEMFSQYRVLSVLFFPLTIAITIPAKSLLQRAFVGDYVWLIVVTGLFFMLTRAFWLFALRSYTSANS